MELIVFDLDGTLLDSDSSISARTGQTLQQLSKCGIPYTVATGRMRHDAHTLLSAYNFNLPLAFKNGVLIWHPRLEKYTHRNLLTQDEIRHVMEAVIKQNISPFVYTLNPGNHYAIFHPAPHHQSEKRLIDHYNGQSNVSLHGLEELPQHAAITNISAIGPRKTIEQTERLIADEQHLVIYTGKAIESKHLGWMDIHHSDASKGAAITRIKREIGATRIICFGDSNNDLSMFKIADESYAPDNANAAIKAAATEVIGHHNEDGIAEFLKRRFNLND